MGVVGGAPGEAAVYALGFNPHAARWNGHAWESLAGTLDLDWMYTLLRGAWHDDGSGQALYIGGGLHGVNGIPSRALVRWRPCAPCYPNCDSSTTPPILNIDDFTCFINNFAQAQSLPHQQQLSHYANCDQSTTAPILNVDDFTCFINAFAQGCP